MTKLEREVRYLKIYALGSALIFALLFLMGFTQSPASKTKFGEIDVERINVVEKSGKLDLVISNAEHMPPAIVNGKVLKAGKRDSGLLFYNGNGDENGGLAFGSTAGADGQYHAGGQLAFDQYKQDQIVAIQYSDNNGKRSAGLRVWDRADVPLDQLYTKFEGLQGAQRAAAIQKLAGQGLVGASRVFVGKLPDKSAQLVLSDAKGKPRLTVAVAADGSPKISFLDADGKPTYTLPPEGAMKPAKQ